MEAVVTILCRYIFSKRFSCEAKLWEACLALFNLLCFQPDLSDIWRLVRELSIKVACITLTLHLGHIWRSDLSLRRTQLQSDHMRCFRNLLISIPVCAMEVGVLFHFFGSTFSPNPFFRILNMLASKEMALLS